MCDDNAKGRHCTVIELILSTLIEASCMFFTGTDSIISPRSLIFNKETPALIEVPNLLTSVQKVPSIYSYPKIRIFQSLYLGRKSSFEYFTETQFSASFFPSLRQAEKKNSIPTLFGSFSGELTKITKGLSSILLSTRDIEKYDRVSTLDVLFKTLQSLIIIFELDLNSIISFVSAESIDSLVHILGKGIDLSPALIIENDSIHEYVFEIRASALECLIIISHGISNILEYYDRSDFAQGLSSFILWTCTSFSSTVIFKSIELFPIYTEEWKQVILDRVLNDNSEFPFLHSRSTVFPRDFVHSEQMDRLIHLFLGLIRCHKSSVFGSRRNILGFAASKPLIGISDVFPKELTHPITGSSKLENFISILLEMFSNIFKQQKNRSNIHQDPSAIYCSILQFRAISLLIVEDPFQVLLELNELNFWEDLFSMFRECESIPDSERIFQKAALIVVSSALCQKNYNNFEECRVVFKYIDKFIDDTFIVTSLFHILIEAIDSNAENSIRSILRLDGIQLIIKSLKHQWNCNSKYPINLRFVLLELLSILFRSERFRECVLIDYHLIDTICSLIVEHRQFCAVFGNILIHCLDIHTQNSKGEHFSPISISSKDSLNTSNGNFLFDSTLKSHQRLSFMRILQILIDNLSDVRFCCELFRSCMCFIDFYRDDYQNLLSVLEFFPKLLSHIGMISAQFLFIICDYLIEYLKGGNFSKTEFRKSGGFQYLLEQLSLAINSENSIKVLDILMNLLVDGKFKNNEISIIQNPDALSITLSIVKLIESQEVRCMYFDQLIQIISSSVINRSICCKFNLFDELLEFLTLRNSSIVNEKLFCLLQLIGSYSINVKQLSQIFVLMQPTERGMRNWLVPNLVKLLKDMCSSSSPRDTFYFDGLNSGLYLSPLKKWPKRGYTFSCWICIESFKSPFLDTPSAESTLLSVASQDGKELSFFFRNLTLFVRWKSSSYSLGAEYEVSFSDYLPYLSSWHLLTISQNANSLFSKSEIKIYVNNILLCEKVFPYPRFGSGTINISIGNDKSKTHSFYGQMGSIYFFENSISPDVVSAVYDIGYSHLGLLSTVELFDGDNQDSTNRSSVSLLEQVIFALNPKARVGEQYIDISSEENSGYAFGKSKVVASRLTGTYHSSTRIVVDIIDSLGGIQLFFPLLLQIDLPIFTDLPSIDKISKCEYLHDIIYIICNLIDSRQVDLHFFEEGNGFGVLFYLLQRLDPKNLSSLVVDALFSLFKVVYVVNNSLVPHVLDVILNFKLWCRANVVVQMNILEKLESIVSSEFMFVIENLELQTFLDIRNTFYKLYDSGRFLDQDFKQLLRKILILCVKFCKIRLCSEEIEAIIGAYFEHDQEDNKVEILELLLEVFDQRQSFVSSHLYTQYRFDFFLSALMSKTENLRLLGLKGFIRLYACVNSEMSNKQKTELLAITSRILSLMDSTVSIYICLLQFLKGEISEVTNYQNGYLETNIVEVIEKIYHPEAIMLILKSALRSDPTLKIRVIQDVSLLLKEDDNRKSFVGQEGWQFAIMDLFIEEISVLNPAESTDIGRQTRKHLMLDMTLRLLVTLFNLEFFEAAHSSSVFEQAISYLSISCHSRNLNTLMGLFLILQEIDLLAKEFLRSNKDIGLYCDNLNQSIQIIEMYLLNSLMNPKDKDDHKLSLKMVWPCVKVLVDLSFSLDTINVSVIPKSMFVKGFPLVFEAELIAKCIFALNLYECETPVLIHGEISQLECSLFNISKVLSSSFSYRKDIDGLQLSDPIFLFTESNKASFRKKNLHTLEDFCVYLLYHFLNFLNVISSSNSSKMFYLVEHPYKKQILIILRAMHTFVKLFRKLLMRKLQKLLDRMNVSLLEFIESSSPSADVLNLDETSWLWYIYWSSELLTSNWQLFKAEIKQMVSLFEKEIESALNHSSVFSKKVDSVERLTKESIDKTSILMVQFDAFYREMIKLCKEKNEYRQGQQKTKTKKLDAVFQKSWETIWNQMNNQKKSPWSVNKTNNKNVFISLDSHETRLRKKLKLTIDHHGTQRRAITLKKSTVHDSDSMDFSSEGPSFPPNLMKRLSELSLHKSNSAVDDIFEYSEKDLVDDTEADEDLLLLKSVNERFIYKLKSQLVSFLSHTDGVIEITNKAIYFYANEDQLEISDLRDNLGNFEEELVQVPSKQPLGIDDKKWDIFSLEQVHIRRHLLRKSALEFFFTDRTTVLFNFYTERKRNKVFKKLLKLRPENMIRNPKLSEMTQKWQNHEISNFEYLMFLNTASGRTFNDLTQYPVYPWIIADWHSQTISLTDPNIYRDLSKPVGALNEHRLALYKERMQNFEDPNIPKFLYGTHYSNSGSVLFYLLRLEPYTTQSLILQDNEFDVADRLFDSLPSAWTGCLTNPADVKELIPEFFYLPEFLKNMNGCDLGVKQNGERLGDVGLPPWARSPEEFIRIHSQALESAYVSEHLHEWIDLIWGYKQKGPEAMAADNLFYYLTYEGQVDIDEIEDPILQRATIDQINNFGQTPPQLLKSPHPRRRRLSDVNTSIFGQLEFVKFHKSIRISGEEIVSVEQVGQAVYTISQNRVLGIHRWKPYVPEVDPPFILDLEKRSSATRRLGVPFDSEIIASNSLFAICKLSKLIFSCGHWDNSIRVSQADSGKLVQRLSHHKDVVTCISLDASSSFLASGSIDSTVRIWDISRQIRGGGPQLSRTPRHILCGHKSPVTSVHVSADLDLVASSSMDGSVLLHSLFSGNFIRSLRDSDSPVSRLLCVSSRGDVAVFSESDLSLSVYTLNGTLLSTAECPEILSAALFSADGCWLVTGGKRRLSVRDSFSLEEAKCLEEDGAGVKSLALTDRERHLLVGGQDGCLKVYALESKVLRKQLLARLQDMGF